MKYVTVNPGSRPKISGAILQAPVSNVELFEIRATEETKWLWRERVKSIYPWQNPYPVTSTDPLCQNWPFQTWNVCRGDDDYFSSMIEEHDFKFAQSSVPLLFIVKTTKLILLSGRHMM